MLAKKTTACRWRNRSIVAGLLLVQPLPLLLGILQPLQHSCGRRHYGHPRSRSHAVVLCARLSLREFSYTFGLLQRHLLV